MPGTPVFIDKPLPVGAPVITGAFQVDGFDSVATLTDEGAQVIREAVGPQMPPGEAGMPGEDGTPGQRGADGPQGPQGATGLPGAPGDQGLDGADGFPGIPGPVGPIGGTGAQGPAGPPGPPGDPGNDGEDGLPGIPGPVGPQGGVGAQGSAGPPGPPGDAGLDGADGFPGIPGPVGPQGITGDTGPQGIPGIPGDQGDRGDDGFPGIPGPQGAQGIQGPIGPQGIPGDQGVQGDSGFPGIPGPQGITGPTGATGAQGPSGVPGPPGDPGPPGEDGPVGPKGPAGTALTLSEGQLVGLPITHAGPGTDGDAVPIDGSVVGESIRFSTTIVDSLISGSVLSYQIPEPSTALVIDAPSFFIFRSCAFTGVGNGTSINGTGRQVLIQLASSSAPVLFKNEDTGEASTGRRFLCPGSVDFLLRPTESVLICQDIINSSAGTRKRVTPFERYQPKLWESQDFEMATVGITNSLSSLVVNGTVHEYWQGISNTGTAGHGSIATVGGSISGHKGVKRITTGATGGDIMSLYLTGAPGSGQNPASACIDMSDFMRADFWVKMGGTADSRIALIGLGQDAIGSSLGAEAAYFQYNTATTGANWACITRSASVSTTNLTSVAVSSTVWVKLSIEIVRSRTTVNGFMFSINDIPQFFHTTNLTTGVLNATLQLQTQSAATKSMDVDRVELYVKEDFLIG